MSQILARFKSRDYLYQGSILLILFLFNYEVLNTWFIIDDTAIIFCSSFKTIRLLFDRDTYLYFNQLFFSPFQPISFKIDWILFKMSPTGYHLHNLLVAFLSCVIFYKILKIYIPPFFSCLGTILLSLSMPLSFDIGWITRKQYLWGFLFSLIVIYSLKIWERNKKSLLMLMSLLSTLLAFLSKEAYAFLPAAVFVVSSGNTADRLKKTFPYIVVFLIYFFWRIFMLGGFGGYPGSTEEPFYFFLNKLFHMPMELSKSSFGFSIFPFLLLIIIGFLSFKMILFITLIALIVISPFVFFPSGSFLLANKTLAFVAVVSFGLSYIMKEVSLRNKRLTIAMIILLYIPILLGSVVKSKDAHETIIRLSDNFEMASKELLENTNEKTLIVSNYSYYFSNLGDIYQKMLKRGFPSVKSVSTIKVLPYLESTDFDRVILANNLDLDPNVISQSSVEVFKGLKARQYLKKKREELIRRQVLPEPEVRFTNTKDHLKIDILDSREGTYLRCLYMGSYVGCYPIPKKYILKYNRIKKIKKVDIIYTSHEGLMSKPARFLN